ncbi:integrator complex subunit 12-like isoform X2 [Argonauta hians]
MATLELDPLFTKALKLLHSKSKDAEYQLRLMVEEVVAQRKGLPVKHDFLESIQEGKKPRLDLFSSLEKEEKQSKEKDRDAERSRKDREPKDKEDRDRREKGMSEKSSVSATEKVEKSSVILEKSSYKEPEIVVSSDDNMDTTDFILDLGIACIMCQQFEVTSGNQLIECQECHHLYHQECHKPAVVGQDVNDPRFVWYCSRCVKSLEKMATKPPKPIKSSSLTNAIESSKTFVVSSGNNKPSKSDTADTILPFRRMESKAPSSGVAAKPMSGLVSLAANLSGKTSDMSKSSLTKSEQTKHSSASSSSKESSKSSSSSSSSSSGPKLDLSEKNLFAAALTMCSKVSSKGSSKTSSGMQMANADKRLQLMKKKAAAKLQEKRSFLK